MRHPLGAGTPGGLAGSDAAVACEICHMPKATSGGFPMHLWRINSSASYRTFPTSAEFIGNTKKIANTSPDGSYANAVWVDVDYACGQCHGGDTNTAKPGLPVFSKATLATFAAGVHSTAPVPVPVNKYTISGTVFQQDGTTGFAGAKVYLKWNGITKALQETVDGTYSFADLTPGDYKVQVYKTGMVFDGDSVTAGVQNPIDVALTSADVPAKNFKRVATTITVNTSPALSLATIYLKQNGVVKANAKTDVAGAAVFTVVPGTYQVQASKTGYSFDGDAVAAGNQNPVTVPALVVNVDVPVSFTHTP
jgi:hypothetical protein